MASLSASTAHDLMKNRKNQTHPQELQNPPALGSWGASSVC